MTIEIPGPTKLATDDHWLVACSAAAKKLARGRDGWFVQSGESWAQAVARVAGLLLRRAGYGRPRGEVPDAWERIVEAVAERGSSAPDGLVEGPSRLRVSIATCDAAYARRLDLERRTRS